MRSTNFWTEASASAFLSKVQNGRGTTCKTSWVAFSWPDWVGAGAITLLSMSLRSFDLGADSLAFLAGGLSLDPATMALSCDFWDSHSRVSSSALWLAQRGIASTGLVTEGTASVLSTSSVPGCVSLVSSSSSSSLTVSVQSCPVK